MCIRDRSPNSCGGRLGRARILTRTGDATLLPWRVHMFVGIDVAKAELVVSVRPTMERFTVANDERGVRTLVERLRAIGTELIVLEATGGYELLGVAALAAAAL